jgi:hypothetical protein
MSAEEDLATRIEGAERISVTEMLFDPFNLFVAYRRLQSELSEDERALIVVALRRAPHRSTKQEG